MWTAFRYLRYVAFFPAIIVIVRAFLPVHSVLAAGIYTTEGINNNKS